MESMIKQTRSIFGGTRQDDKDERSSTTDRKIPPQKTQSFREKNRSQSWIRRQLSRQMSWDNDFGRADYPTAVAAAAYAIKSLEESKSRDQKETSYGPDKSFNKMKSKVEDTGVLPEVPGKSSLKPSDETSKMSFTDTSTSKKMPEKKPTIKKKISFSGIDEIATKKPERPALEKATERAPSMMRPSNFADKQLNIADGKNPGTTTTQPVETRMQTTRISGPGDSTADAWEKEEMARIKERYEKMRATIDNWETKKKKKAKRNIERIEAELDRKRVKALKSYNSEMARIEGIAGGAKARAEENRRNEEFKVKEKAKKIRSTGKLPATCLCI